MSRRTDYYNDPDAPPATRIVPGAQVLITDQSGRVLLQRRADSGNWSAPGGVMDIGETLAETAVREVKEETGLDVEITGLLGLYTDPRHVIAYADGEVRQEFVVAFTGRPIGGQLEISDESTELRWVPITETDDLPMHQTARLRLQHLAEGRLTPHLG
ncbi:NUDIX domain-containing protein [Dactylosporangium siamense]|uniref:NUDIX domain-containing protein n=1 Tax=Dactylosporangium siamense TaxID=685454 RepID=UPI0019454978|nr:NUDIX domain-containing protein [Dactylosporangium siamense]